LELVIEMRFGAEHYIAGQSPTSLELDLL
jgi:hypothetical protein